MSCAFIEVGESMAIQTDSPHGYVSLVSLDPQLGNHTQQSHHHPGQIIIHTNEGNQSSFTYSTSEHRPQILSVEEQQPTLLLVSTSPEENSEQFTLTQEAIKTHPIQQQILLLTEFQGSSQGAIIQMPSTASVIQVPGVLTNGDQAVTFIGAHQSNPMTIESSNTVYVANPESGEIILCLQPGDVTALQMPSTILVDGSNTCFTTIEPQTDDVSQSDLARSWQVDSDLVNRALNALSSLTSVQNSNSSVTPVETVNSSVVHLCSHVSPPH